MSMVSRLRAVVYGVALSASTLAAAAAETSGYFTTAGAPLYAPSGSNAGDAGSTLARQQASGYFAEPYALLLPPTLAPGDGGATLAKQRASGYFPAADAPLVPPTSNLR